MPRGIYPRDQMKARSPGAGHYGAGKPGVDPRDVAARLAERDARYEVAGPLDLSIKLFLEIRREGEAP